MIFGWGLVGKRKGRVVGKVEKRERERQEDDISGQGQGDIAVGERVRVCECGADREVDEGGEVGCLFQN